MKSKTDSGDSSSLKAELKKKEEANLKMSEENNSLKSQIDLIRNESIASK